MLFNISTICNAVLSHLLNRFEFCCTGVAHLSSLAQASSCFLVLSAELFSRLWANLSRWRSSADRRGSSLLPCLSKFCWTSSVSYGIGIDGPQ